MIHRYANFCNSRRHVSKIHINKFKIVFMLVQNILHLEPSRTRLINWLEAESGGSYGACLINVSCGFQLVMFYSGWYCWEGLALSFRKSKYWNCFEKINLRFNKKGIFIRRKILFLCKTIHPTLLILNNSPFFIKLQLLQKSSKLI